MQISPSLVNFNTENHNKQFFACGNYWANRNNRNLLKFILARYFRVLVFTTIVYNPLENKVIADPKK